MPKPSELGAPEPLGSGVTEVHEQRCPTSAGAVPAVLLEAKAFEAPHEKCHNTQ